MTPTELFHEAYAAGIPYGQSDDIFREQGEDALRAEIALRQKGAKPVVPDGPAISAGFSPGEDHIAGLRRLSELNKKLAETTPAPASDE